MIDALGFAMAAQFKPDGHGGFHYRKDQTGAALPATRGERDAYVRWYGWVTLSSLVVMSALMITLAVVMDALMPDPGNSQGAVGAIVMASLAMGATYLYLKWFSHAPARAMIGRTPAAPATTLRVAHGRKLARLSWTKLAVRIAGLMLLCLFALREHPEGWWLAIGLPLTIGLGIGWWKWRVERSPA